jgi:hypothetical protein
LLTDVKNSNNVHKIGKSWLKFIIFFLCFFIKKFLILVNRGIADVMFETVKLLGCPAYVIGFSSTCQCLDFWFKLVSQNY